MSQLNHLFVPIKVGNLTLKNRLVMTSMAPGTGYNLPGGKPTSRLIRFLEERAKGGVALICNSVSFYPNPWEHGTHAYSDDQIPDLMKVADAVHKHGALLAGQLMTVGQWSRHPDEPDRMWGASEKVFHKGLTPRTVMSRDDIKLFISHQTRSARILKAAGWDAVEILAGIGNPISHFMSKASNDRTDEYGGSIENRCRFLVEIIQSIKEACGKDFPILVRFSPIDYIPGGNDLDDAKQIVPILEKAGVAWLNCQAGWHESSIPLTTKDIPDGYWSFITAELKKVATVPLVSAYRYSDPLVMEKTIAEGKADIIGGARYLVADPEFVNKAKDGRLEDIRKCICCCRCIDDVVSRFQGLEYCSVNPNLGPELEEPLKRADRSKTVMVAGSGPAGLSAALTAAKRGHNVTIYERSPRIGGCLVISSVFNPIYGRLTQYYKVQLKKNTHIKIKLNTPVTPDLIRTVRPDAVVIAIGGRPIDLKVPGAQNANVLSSHNFLELLSGHAPEKPGLINKFMFNAGAVFSRYFYSSKLMKMMMGLKWPFGSRVAIIGGGLPGCDLGMELGKHKRELVILEESKRIGFDIGASDRFQTISKLKRLSVQMEPLTRVSAITDKGVQAKRSDGTDIFYEADTVAVTLGFQKNMDMAEKLQAKMDNIFVIGDCAEPKRMPDATKQGYRVALQI